jgi:hypothetical protein
MKTNGNGTILPGAASLNWHLMQTVVKYIGLSYHGASLLHINNQEYQAAPLGHKRFPCNRA